MQNILVTGGCGFVGSNLTLELQDRYPDAQITVIDDFRGSCFKNLIGFKGDVLPYSVADKKWFDSYGDRPLDVIFHMASITDTTVLDECKMMYDNVEGFRNILDFAVRKNASVVYASSAAVYGSQDHSMKEVDGGIPNNIYGYSKWILENLANKYKDQIETLIGLRFFNVFGPRESFKGHASSMIYQWALKMKDGIRPRLFKMGDQRRDHVYVKDVVSAVIKAKDAKTCDVLNVGTGNATSFNEIIATLNEALGTSLEPEYFENPYDFYQDFTQADMSKTKEVIGFEGQYSTPEGIKDYVCNYLLK